MTVCSYELVNDHLSALLPNCIPVIRQNLFRITNNLVKTLFRKVECVNANAIRTSVGCQIVFKLDFTLCIVNQTKAENLIRYTAECGIFTIAKQSATSKVRIRVDTNVVECNAICVVQVEQRELVR
ncbi:hypothetical protein D3C71_826490 [compost metagenome]